MGKRVGKEFSLTIMELFIGDKIQIMRTYHFQLFLLCVGIMLILCTPFTGNLSLADRFVAGKVTWMQPCIWIFSVMSVFACLPISRKQYIVKSSKLEYFPDLLLLLFAIITLLTYNWDLNPSPNRLLIEGQLLVLWFTLRLNLTRFPLLKGFILGMLILTVTAEAWIGLSQIYGSSKSNHSIFRLTGTFYNPGPYSGYLAVLLPVCLGEILRFRNCNKKRWWEPAALRYYCAFVALAIILVILPAGLSRTAWIAAGVSCIFVYFTLIPIKRPKEKLVSFTNHHSIIFVFSCAFIVLLSISSIFALYNMKQDSAKGRILTWKISSIVIAEHPLKGVGLGGFPAAYAKEQALYFSSDKCSDTEKMVAGCPQYAFNEFLEIAIETGIIGALLFLGWLGICFFRVLKNKQIGIAGGILSLVIFASASYPLQLPEFWIVLITLTAIGCSAPIRHKQATPNKITLSSIFIFSLIICGASTYILHQQIHDMDDYEKWNDIKILYNAQAYQKATKEYQKLYPALSHHPEFLFEMAQCLYKTKQYTEARKILKRATQLSADPMIWYLLAKNEQALGEYQKAEALLLHAINILPERIYPWYLLTKLYADPNFLNTEKMYNAAHQVLTKEPKIQSSAIREMREEVGKILNEWETSK